jgi:hypothetical protein
VDEARAEFGWWSNDVVASEWFFMDIRSGVPAFRRSGVPVADHTAGRASIPRLQVFVEAGQVQNLMPNFWAGAR